MIVTSFAILLFLVSKYLKGHQMKINNWFRPLFAVIAVHLAVWKQNWFAIISQNLQKKGLKKETRLL